MKKIPFEYKITLLYVFLGALWILFSDHLVISLTKDVEKIYTISTYKGWFYVVITGILLLLILKSESKRRNKIFNQLLEAKKKADEADKLKTAFLTNLSHYIRTPMNSILGFIDLLENKNNSPEKQQLFLKYINDRSNHLLQTLNHIIEIAKIQEGQYTIVKSKFNLYELIQDVVKTGNLEITQLNKNVVIKTNIDTSEANGEVYSDQEIVHQILSHLVSNAVIFTKEGEIAISCLFANSQYKICVKDTGTGVIPEKIDSLFNEFLHTSSYIYTEGEGAGLGLFLSYKLTVLLNGKLWLESSSSKGSNFCFSLVSEPS